jgi:hypothetical protein
MEMSLARRTPLDVAASVALVAILILALAGPLMGRARAVAGPPCGALFTDPEGDATFAPPGSGAAENFDTIGGGIAAETATSFTTEIDIKNLSKDLGSDPSVTGATWTFYWTSGDVMYASQAKYTQEGDVLSYSFGTVTQTANGGTLYTPSAVATTGEFKEGAGGYVRVVVPLAEVGQPAAGDKLTEIYARNGTIRQVPMGPSSGSTLDRGPDGTDFGTDYTLGSCKSSGGGGTATSPGVTLRFDTLKPKKGAVDKAHAGLKICKGHAGKNISLQRKKSGVFKTVATKKLSSTCKATFKVRAKFNKATFRALWPKQDADHKKGTSKPVTVTTH